MVDHPMIRPPGLPEREHGATRELVRRLFAAPARPPERIILFGSRARGDFRPGSDVDLLLLCDEDHLARRPLARAHRFMAREVAWDRGVDLETWTLTGADLEAGRRTPMLVDALDDGIDLWPTGKPPLRLRFTPADAVFCAECLLRWVDAGGRACRQALRQGRDQEAATQARDDIVRLASTALLLLGETRHRGRGSLRLFEDTLVRGDLISPAVRQALDWAAGAFPDEAQRSSRRAPATASATRSADAGYALAYRMQEETLPWIRHRLLALRDLLC